MNCPTYYAAEDLTTCRTPCINHPQRLGLSVSPSLWHYGVSGPSECVAAPKRICCGQSRDCRRHRCCE